MSTGNQNLFDFLGELFGLATDVAAVATEWTTDKVLRYAALLKKAGKYLFFIALGALVLVILGVVLRQGWLGSLGVITLGGSLACVLVLGVPLGLIAVKATEIASVRRYFRFIGGLLLGFLLFALLLARIPVWNRPQLLALFILGALILALLYALFGLGPSPRAIYSSVMFVLFVSILGAFLPKSFGAGRGLPQKLDDCLSKPADCWKTVRAEPHRSIQVKPDVRLFDAETGKPVVWFARSQDGGYELFNREGFHPLTGEPLLPMTREVAENYRQWQTTSPRGGSVIDVLPPADKPVSAAGQPAREVRAARPTPNSQAALVSRVLMYVDSSARNGPDRDDIALLVVDEEGDSVGEILLVTGQSLSASGKRTSTPFGKEFVSKGLHRSLFGGGAATLVREQQLTNVCDRVLIGVLRQRYTLHDDPTLSGMTTANLDLDMRTISARTGEVVMQFNFRSKGGGFSKEAARDQAMERLAQDVAKRLSDGDV